MMRDWTPYHAAVLAGTMQGEIPAACERAWSWLDLPADERQARIVAGIDREDAARWMLQALPYVRQHLLREAGIAADDHARFAALDEALRAGRATPAELDLVRRFGAAVEIGQHLTTLFPAAALPPPAVDPQKAALAAALPALTDALRGCEVGIVTPAALATLREAVDVLARAGQDFTPPVAQEHGWWLGLGWWAIGRGALELGRIDEGRAAYENSAASYERADDAKSVAECRRLISDLDLHRAADFDSAVAQELESLLSRQDPLGRVESLTRLVSEAGNAGDLFEAQRLGEEAAKLLGEAGYPDPEPGVDEALDRWIASAARNCAGNAVFARLCQVAQFWAAVLGARASARARTDAAASDGAQQCLRRLGKLAVELYDEAGNAEQDAARRYALWYPEAALQPYERQGFDPSVERGDALAALDDALYRLRLACNEHPDAAQLDIAAALRSQAQMLGSRLHVARAELETAYVLLALGRPADVAAHARAAVVSLVGDGTPGLGAFATAHERESYLTAIGFEARALAAQGKHDAILALCEPVIRDIEGERAKVSSPYQQSAFLATRAELYEFAAAAAYKAQRWDLLLAITELLKARAALRSRLAPADTGAADDLALRLQEVDAALAAAPRGSGDERELRERRRWLTTARAIARARRAGADLPEITVAALQQALRPDEAALSWFWVAPDVLIALAITTEDMHPALVRLDAGAQAQLADYLGALGQLSGAEPDYARLIPRVGALIAALGEVLLPAELRAAIAAKARLVVCPHRTLHLFPFHALTWRDGATARPLATRFTVGYVPSLSSLLLPWEGRREGPVLAVGVARFAAPQLPPLPNAETEAAAVAAAHGAAGTLLVGATKAQFTALPLADYRCLHLATHGSSVLAGDAVDDPLQSCLEFADGALSGWDLAGLRLRAELVVLAACHSGQRSIAGRGLDRLPGDDIFGLQAVLFDAGAGSVLGTLWPVEDATAQAILVDFHRAYAGGATPEAALQAAVIAHLADPRRRRGVFYWAPFFVASLGRREPRAGASVPVPAALS
jgi:CHAT domain-containing protein